jgi:hypothetical protein
MHTRLVTNSKRPRKIMENSSREMYRISKDSEKAIIIIPKNKTSSVKEPTNETNIVSSITPKNRSRSERLSATGTPRKNRPTIIETRIDATNDSSCFGALTSREVIKLPQMNAAIPAPRNVSDLVNIT